jgi:hypothetical protein
MASIRDLKKDVKYLVGHFIDECYTQLAFSAVNDQENTLDIISDALKLLEATIQELNTIPSKSDKIAGKLYYNTIAENFYKQIIELTDRLHSLNN